MNEIYEAIPQILRCTMAQPISCLALARFSYAKVRARHWVIGPEISFRSSLKYVGTHIFHLNLCYVGTIPGVLSEIIFIKEWRRSDDFQYYQRAKSF